MPFTIQDQNSGLFWSQGLWGRVGLSSTPENYVLDGTLLRREHGGFIGHRFNILHEGDVANFVFNDGVITCDGLQALAGAWVTVVDGEGSRWVVTEVVEDEVPVNRAAALIEQSLNAQSQDSPVETPCSCENCECDPCDCGSHKEILN